MADRRAELERKKKQLAALRDMKSRAQNQSGLSAFDLPEGIGQRSSRRQEANDLLESLGIGSRDSTPAPRGDRLGDSLSSPKIAPNTATLSDVSTQTTCIPPKESVTYTKETQTAIGTERDSQPLDYYVIHWDEEAEWEDEFPAVLTYDDLDEEAEGSSLNFGTPPQSYRPNARVRREQREQRENASSGLPHVEMVKPAQTQQDTSEVVEKLKERRELSDEEKLQIMRLEPFRNFFDRAARITERAIYANESQEIFVDYAGLRTDVENEDKKGGSLCLNRCFFDERWSRNRCVTSFDWCDQYPELLLASYNKNDEAPNDPDGVCLVWNMKFKKKTPEYVFHSQSAVMSACFAKFHPNLVVGGTYSGQLVLWDNRSHKKTPVQRSPLSASAHTHPIYCIQVVGTQNAHNIITISTDGKLCSWSLDMLSQPQDTLELSQQKQNRAVAVTSVSFPQADNNNFFIGSEEGAIYGASRHGSKAGIIDVYEGHQGPVTGVHCHPVQGQVDFSHLFLSSSIDWTVKLWSTKENKPLHSFEDNNDYVFDVKWSPVNPALFATADLMGRIDLWNVNNDTELPTASTVVEGNAALNKLIWTPNGSQVVGGGDDGKVWVYDVGEQLAIAKGDESTQLIHTLQELKQSQMEHSDSVVEADLAYASMSSASMASFASPLK